MESPFRQQEICHDEKMTYNDAYQPIGFVSGSDLHRFRLLNRIERVVFPDRSGLKSLRDHPKEPQRFFNRFSFICGALRLLHILCLCLIVAFPPNDSAFPINLRDIQR